MMIHKVSKNVPFTCTISDTCDRGREEVCWVAVVAGSRPN